MTDAALTDTEMASAAERAAKAFARKKPGADWREFVGFAWEGARRAVVAGHPQTAVQTAVYEIIDKLRAETGHRRKNRVAPVSLDATREDGSPVFDPADYRATHASDDEYARRLAAWGEAKAARDHACATMATRVTLYLFAVEQMTAKAVAECLGICQTAVWNRIMRFRKVAKNARTAAGGGETRGGGEGGGGTGAGGGAGGGVPLAGVATEGDPPVRIDRVCGEAADPCGVDGGGGPGVEVGAGEDGRGAAELRRGTGAAGAGGEGAAQLPENGGETTGLVPADRTPARRPGKRSVAAVVTAIPDPAEVSSKAAVLRAGMFDAIGAEDVDDVMRALMGKAKAGDVKATKLFFALLGQNGK